MRTKDKWRSWKKKVMEMVRRRPHYKYRIGLIAPHLLILFWWETDAQNWNTKCKALKWKQTGKIKEMDPRKANCF